MSEDVPAGFMPYRGGGNYIAHVGPFYEKPEGDNYVRGFRMLEKHANPLLVAHGGLMCTFADSVLGRKVRTVAAGGAFVTARMVVDFLGGVKIGDWVEGRATITRTTRSLVFLRAEVTVGDQPVLSADAIFKLLSR